MPIEKPRMKAFIKVDSREPQMVYDTLKAMGVSYVVEKLDYGDFEGEHLVMERKHFPDLYQSIRDMRLFDQVHGLVDYADEVGKLPVLGVHGGVEELPSDVQINEEVIYGAIASVSIRYGVQVVWVRSLYDLL